MHALDILPRILVELACSFASRRDLSLSLRVVHIQNPLKLL